MSSIGEHFWQYGIKCDHPGCEVAIWRVAVSEAIAHTEAQQAAKAAKWEVARDRGRRLEVDLCPEHALMSRNPRALR